jgi:hypothetical protein
VSSTAPEIDSGERFVTVVHPFHPLSGRRYRLVEVRHAFVPPRAFFLVPEGDLRSVPVPWTDLAALDPFKEMAAGRSPFRAGDLLELAALIDSRRDS